MAYLGGLRDSAEIQAAESAIQRVKEFGYAAVTIRTDSKFVVDSVTLWLPTWQANGWRRANGAPVENREDFERLIEAMRGLHVNFVHVPGHQGIWGNEQAHQLAQAGARM